MPYRSRILDPGCSWLILPEVQVALDDLQRQDSFVVGYFAGMRQDATDEGMLRTLWRERKDYRAPLERAPERVVDPPWLGELKGGGKPRRRKAGLEWRQYFSEPVETPGLVVVCGLSCKDPAESQAAGMQRQEDAIRAAMARFQRFCRQSQLTYPPFEPS